MNNLNFCQMAASSNYRFYLKHDLHFISYVIKRDVVLHLTETGREKYLTKYPNMVGII